MLATLDLRSEADLVRTPAWIGLIARLEDYAKGEGCRAMRIYGRRGWLRILPDYRQIAIVAEKQLDN